MKPHLLPRFAAGALAILLTCCGALTACSSEGDKDDNTVRVGVQPVIAILPLYVGIKQGFFKDEGLTVEPVSGQTGPALVTQTLNGQLDMAFVGSPVLINAAAADLPLRHVVTTNVTAGPGGKGGESQILVGAESGIERPRDLSGKRVAVNSLESLLHTAARHVVDQDGGDGSKVQFVEVPFASMQASLRSGEVDAVVTAEPFVTMGLDSGEATTLATLWDKLPPELPVAVIATSASGAEDTEKMAAFQRAWATSVKFTNAHLDESRTELTAYTDIDASLTERLNMSTWSADLIGDRAGAGLTEIAEIEQEFGFVESVPDMSTVVK